MTIAGLLTAIRKAWRSPALRSAAAMAAGGVGFAIGNLLLARTFSETEFGQVSLVLSLIQVGAALGAPGLPILINRYRLAVTPGLLRRSAMVALLAGIAIAGTVIWWYGLATGLALILGVTVAIAALGRVAAAFFQSREHFGTSLLLTQIHNWLLLASVPIVLLLGAPSAIAVASVVLGGYLVITTLGWRLAWRWRHAESPSIPRRRWLAEGLGAAGFMLANNLIFQLDRLLIGGLLTIQDLATYSVVAAVAGSAFRMLQVGAGHALVPRLRGCKRRSAALALLRGEGLLIGAIGVLAALGIIVVMPWLIDQFLGGRYEVPRGLVGLLIAIGFVRIWEASASAVVNALGSTRQLLLLNVLGWLTVAVMAASAVWGSRHGLLGVVFALGTGWLVMASGASVLAARALSRLERAT